MTQMIDQPKKCGKCAAGPTYILLVERLAKTLIFSCRRCGWIGYILPGEPPTAKPKRPGLARHRSGKTIGEFRDERRREADALDHRATNTFLAEGSLRAAAAALGMTERRAASLRQRHRIRYGLAPRELCCGHHPAAKLQS